MRMKCKDYYGPFKYGLAWYSKEGKGVGFINTAGEEVIECGRFSNTTESFNRFGYASVQDMNGFQGIIDRQGNYLIKPIHKYILFLDHSPLVGVTNYEFDDWSVINPQEEDRILGTYMHIGNTWDSPRKDLINIDVSPMRNNNMSVPVHNGDKWGVINEKGELIIPHIYDSISFHNNWVSEKFLITNYFVARTGDSYTRNYRKGKYGLVSIDGNVKLDFLYDDLCYVSDNCIVIGRQKRCGFKYGIITLNREVVIPCEYDKIYVGDGVISVKKGLWWGWTDTNGRMLVKPKFYVKNGRLKFSEGFACINDPYTEKQGFINKAGEIIIPCEFSSHSQIEKFSNGLAYYTKSRNRRGWIDQDGCFAIPPIYHYSSDFSEEGLASVELNGESFYIDRTGTRCLF